MTKETKEAAKTVKKTTKTTNKKDVDTGVLFAEEETVVEVDVAAEKKENIPENNGRIGTLLKEARIKQGKKIPEVSKDLCIRKVYLEAIETSNYKELPEFPYGAGFVRSYADYLGLNGTRIVQLFKEETSVAPKKKQDPFLTPKEEPVEVTTPNKKYIVISLLAIVLVYAAWLMFNSIEIGGVENTNVVENENTEDDFPLIVEDYAEATPVEAEVTVIDTTIAVESNPQVVVTEESFYEEPKPAEEVVEKEEAVTDGVVLNVKDETWVEVKDENKLYLSKVLKAGDTYVVPNKGKGIVYSVGRRGAVDVVINGKVVNVLPVGRSTNIKLDSFLNH